MCVCVCTHTYIHTCTHVYTYTHTHTHTGAVSLPQTYAARVFDSVLTVAYALRDYLRDGHVINPPSYGQNVCGESKTDWWREGNLLAEYIARV